MGQSPYLQIIAFNSEMQRVRNLVFLVVALQQILKLKVVVKVAAMQQFSRSKTFTKNPRNFSF